MKLSACYIVRNEILSLPESIQHMKKIVDEVCIVDTGSIDGTKQYAEHAADKYADFRWCDDFSAARNESLKLATGDWIIVVDADEWVHEEDRNKLRGLMLLNNVDVYSFTIFNFMQDPLWIQKPYIIKGYIERMFRSDKDYRYEGIVHNKLNLNGASIGRSGLAINNFKFREKPRIKEKAIQSKRLMDIKIKEQGWTSLNCIHYADIYRGLWIWYGDIKNGKRAIHYINMALKQKYVQKYADMRNSILKGVQDAEFKRQSA